MQGFFLLKQVFFSLAVWKLSEEYLILEYDLLLAKKSGEKFTAFNNRKKPDHPLINIGNRVLGSLLLEHLAHKVSSSILS